MHSIEINSFFTSIKDFSSNNFMLMLSIKNRLSLSICNGRHHIQDYQVQSNLILKLEYARRVPAIAAIYVT
jgi:hypothetical protein